MSQLEQFQNAKYLSLETVRKNGRAVATPVWFAEENGRLCVWTAVTSGKARRIRNTAAVRIALCDQRGGLKGDWVTATAGVLSEPAQVQRITNLLRQKYGLMMRLFELMGSLRKHAHVGLEIAVR